MLRLFAFSLGMIGLTACSVRGADQEVTQDYSMIMGAVLTAQPDAASQHREFVAQYPEEASWLDGFFDYRTCVTRETAGTKGDFEQPRWDDDAPPPDFGNSSKRWEQSTSRQPIPSNLLPDHLRWNAAFSICPNGVLRFGNPEIQGERATVYVENTSSIHGWAGEIELVKIDDEWIVQQTLEWWQA